MGRERSLTRTSPLLCARQCSEEFPHSFDSHSNPEKKVVFSLVFQMRLTEASGVSKLRGQGHGRAGTRNETRSPCKPTCLGLWCILKAMRKDPGGLESELPDGACLCQCPGNYTCNSLLRFSAFCYLTGGLSRVPL